MFTGLIETTGEVQEARKAGSEMDLAVDLGGLPEAPAIGASIALSGVCCTVTGLARGVAAFRLSLETLERSWFGDLAAGTTLNIEDSLRAGDPLGGHLVQGHVDGVARVVAAVDPEAGGDLRVRLPGDLARYCAEKGSIALDGISLTVAGLTGDEVTVAVIPHTAQVTTLGSKREGDPMNVEVDILAKYVERMLQARG